MTSGYDKIYSCFLSKVTEYKFLQIPEDDTYELLRTWLHSAVGVPYFRRLFTTLSLDDEILTVTYTFKHPVDDESDEAFLTEVLARYMVIAWMEPQVKSTDLMAQMFGGKEQKFYSQSAHLNELKTILADAKTEVRKMIRDRGYINNSYLSEA